MYLINWSDTPLCNLLNWSDTPPHNLINCTPHVRIAHAPLHAHIVHAPPTRALCVYPPHAHCTCTPTCALCVHPPCVHCACTLPVSDWLSVPTTANQITGF